jgi:hypothetical protein
VRGTAASQLIFVREFRLVGLTCHNPNPSVLLVAGREITVQPVQARGLATGDTRLR